MANLPGLNSNEKTSINFVNAEIPDFRKTMIETFSGIQSSLPTTDSFTKAFSTMLEKNPLGSAIEPLRETVTDLKKTLDSTFQDLRSAFKDLPLDLSEMMKQSLPEPLKQDDNVYDKQIEKEEKNTFYTELKKVFTSPIEQMQTMFSDMTDANIRMLDSFSPTGNKKEGGALERLKEEEEVEREEQTNFYLKNILDVLKKDSKLVPQEEGKGFFGNLFDKFGFKGIGSLLPKLLGGGAILGALGSIGLGAMLVGGIAKAVWDGISGWMKADEWGVSNIAGLIGGFLGGTSENEMMRIFGNMGKFAALGAVVGSVVPVVGTIAGGLIGAVVGGILGWIGGEKIAQTFDSIGSWFVDTWKTVKENLSVVWDEWVVRPIDNNLIIPLKELGKYLTDAWENKEKLLKDFWKKWIVKPIEDSIITPLKLLGKELVDAWDKSIGLLEELWQEYVIDPIDKFVLEPIRNLSEWWDELDFEFPSMEPITDFFQAIRNFFSMDFPSVKDLYNFLTGSGPAPQSSTYTPGQIGVDNMKDYENELLRYAKSLSSFELPGPRPLDTDTSANEEGLQKLKDREGFLGKAREERYQTGEVVKDDYGRTKYTVGHGVTDTFPVNRDFLKLSLEEMFEKPKETGGVRKVTKDDTMTRDEADKYLRFLTEQKRGTLNDQYDWFNVLDTTRQNALIDMHYQHGPGGFSEYKNMIGALEKLENADLKPEEKQKILSEVAFHMEDSEWFRNQTTNRAKGVIGDFARGDRVRNVSPEVQEKGELPSVFDDFGGLAMMKDSVRGLGSLLMADGRFTALQKAGGYIAKDPSLIISGEYNGAGENPEVTIQMNALENRILATTRKLFEQTNEKDMDLLTTTYEQRLQKAMQSTQQSENRVRQKEMAEQKMLQVQMPVTTSSIDNKTINNVSQPIVMQHSAKNERNYFRMA